MTPNPLQALGAQSLRWVLALGQIGVFTGGIGAALATPPLRVRRIVDEVFNIGVLSLLIVGVSGLVVGMVLGLTGYRALTRFGAESSLGVIVGLALIRELGPVLTSLLVAGRAGSAVAAEIGAMVATEQLDGLRMMSVDPVHFVAAPKALAMAIAMPLLSALFIVAGVWGGYLVGVEYLGIDGGSYLTSLEDGVEFSEDVLGSLVKSAVFGVLVGLIATFRGYTAEPSAEGVARATTGTVVVASVTTLVFNYFITALWGV